MSSTGHAGGHNVSSAGNTKMSGFPRVSPTTSFSKQATSEPDRQLSTIEDSKQEVNANVSPCIKVSLIILFFCNIKAHVCLQLPSLIVLLFASSR